MAIVPYVESAVEGLEYDLLSLFQPCLEDSNSYPELTTLPNALLRTSLHTHTIPLPHLKMLPPDSIPL